MGVFPEVDRVWMTIDNDLYLWSYVDGYEVIRLSYTHVSNIVLVPNFLNITVLKLL